MDKGLGRREGIAANYTNLGAIAEQRADTCEAHRLWTFARDLYDQIGAGPMVEKVQGYLDELPPN